MRRDSEKSQEENVHLLDVEQLTIVEDHFASNPDPRATSERRL